jgi:hypothetical protein
MRQNHSWEANSSSARKEVHIRFLWGDLRERDHLEDLGVGGDIIKMDLQESGRKIWTGFIWLRISPVGERL